MGRCAALRPEAVPSKGTAEITTLQPVKAGCLVRNVLISVKLAIVSASTINAEATIALPLAISIMFVGWKLSIVASPNLPIAVVNCSPDNRFMVDMLEVPC